MLKSRNELAIFLLLPKSFKKLTVILLQAPRIFRYFYSNLTIMILCIGPKGAGKTLLLHVLQKANLFSNPFDEIYATIPIIYYYVDLMGVSPGDEKYFYSNLTIMILCIGPKGAGKTLLLRVLQKANLFSNPFDEIYATIPTMGVNIASVKVDQHTSVQINELGGSMAAIWPMYYEDIKGLIFVIDIVNLFQISCACILLLETLKHNLLKNTKILIALNKTDIYCSTKLSEMKFILRLDDISLHAKQDITIVECSCLTGKGVKDIQNWLLQFL